MHADTLAVAAPGQDGSGQLDLFARTDGRWQLQQRIAPPLPCAGCAFGHSVALGAERLIVGEPGSGGVFVYRFEQGAWRRDRPLRDAQSPALGTAVAIDGDTLAAGSGNGDAVLVFVRDVATAGQPWIVQARLAADGNSARFGQALALHGDVLAVGAPSPGTGVRGAIQLYTRTGTRWQAGERLAAPTTGASGFGAALALHGDTLLAGADASRRAHVYTRDGTRWRQTAVLQPLRNGDDAFGASVALSALSGSDLLQAIVGAPLASNGTRRDAGLAQRHRGRGDTWDAGLLLQPAEERDAHAGWAVASSGGATAIGIPDMDRGGIDRGAVALHADDTGAAAVLLDAGTAMPATAPVIEETAAIEFAEGAQGSVRVRIQDADTPLAALTVIAQSTDPSQVDDSGIRLSDIAGGRRIELTPDGDAHGDFAIDLLASDGHSVATRRIPVRIAPINDAPSFRIGTHPSFAPRPGTAPRLVQNFVLDFDPGPRESAQTLIGGELSVVADAAGVVTAAALQPTADGRGAHLLLHLSGRAGTAHYDLRVRDSGGRANGGNDLSAARRFTITVAADPDALLFDGFE